MLLLLVYVGHFGSVRLRARRALSVTIEYIQSLFTILILLLYSVALFSIRQIVRLLLTSIRILTQGQAQHRTNTQFFIANLMFNCSTMQSICLNNYCFAPFHRLLKHAWNSYHLKGASLEYCVLGRMGCHFAVYRFCFMFFDNFVFFVLSFALLPFVVDFISCRFRKFFRSICCYCCLSRYGRGEFTLCSFTDVFRMFCECFAY